MVRLLPVEKASLIETIKQERIQCAAEIAKIILNLKPELEKSLSSSGLMDPKQVEYLQYAMIKAVETVGKSLLSKCLLT